MSKTKFRFSRKLLAIPYGLFLAIFVVIPLLLIIYFSFTDSDNNFTLSNVTDFFSDTTNINTVLVSLLIGVGTTVICLIIGYPIAYIIANKENKMSFTLVLLFVMPMWINFVLRTAATRDLLSWIGISGGEHPYLTTMIGMVYNYLPFVILPLYTTMIKMDRNLIEASMDLGANKVQTFFKAVIPMTMPGIISAVSMVFMPTMSSYVISDVMGERKISLIGNIIQLYFDQIMWNMGSFVALILMAFIFIGMFITKDSQREEISRGSLW